MLVQIDEDVADALRRETSIPRTNDLGRYLGSPLIHERVCMELQRAIGEFHQTLGGLEEKYVVSSRKITLAKSMLNMFLTYQIQSARLPKEVVHEIDRRICHFIWREAVEIRGKFIS